MSNNFIKIFIITGLFFVLPYACAGNEIRMGDSALDKGNYNQAAIHFEKALAEKKSFKAYLGLGNAQSNLGNWSKAAKAYRLALRLKSNSPDIDVLKNLGLAEYMGGEYEKSIETFHSLYEKEVDYDTQIWLARCYIKTRQWTRGQNILFRCLEKKPEDTQSLELLAYLFTKTDRMEEAISIHKKLAHKYPGQIKYLLALAKAQTAAEDYSRAINTLEFANRITAEPSAEADRLLADLYVNNNMYRQAAFFYQKIILNLESPSVEDFFRLGYCYYQSGEYFSAKKAFEKIRQIDESNSQAVIYLGHIASENGDLESAGEFYMEATNIDNTSTRPYLFLAELEFNNKNYSNAAKYFSKAISVGEQPLSIHYNYILSLMLNDQFDSAKKAITEAISKYPDSEKLNRLLDRLINKSITSTK